MVGNLAGWHFLIVLAVILLAFGLAKLPALARSISQSARVFRSEMKTNERNGAAAAVESASAAPPSATMLAEDLLSTKNGPETS